MSRHGFEVQAGDQFSFGDGAVAPGFQLIDRRNAYVRVQRLPIPADQQSANDPTQILTFVESEFDIRPVTLFVVNQQPGANPPSPDPVEPPVNEGPPPPPIQPPVTDPVPPPIISVDTDPAAPFPDEPVAGADSSSGNPGRGNPGGPSNQPVKGEP